VQKVVDLTFADEGIQVIAVSDGEQAIARLDTFLPDIVLADVFMPKVNGYEVCDYVKRHDRLSHIPVMLLVGSFEPFDEAEARRNSPMLLPLEKPLIVTYGTAELPELQRQSVDFAGAKQARLESMVGHDHFTILEELALPAGKLTALLRTLLRLTD